jgi:hypothetical protein
MKKVIAIIFLVFCFMPVKAQETSDELVANKAAIIQMQQDTAILLRLNKQLITLTNNNFSYTNESGVVITYGPDFQKQLNNNYYNAWNNVQNDFNNINAPALEAIIGAPPNYSVETQ